MIEINPDPKTAYADYMSGDTDTYHPLSDEDKIAAMVEYFQYTTEQARAELFALGEIS